MTRISCTQAYYASRQYRRAVALLRSAGVLEDGAEFLHLAACCLAETGDWEEVVSLLGDDEAEQDPQSLEVRALLVAMAGCHTG